MESKFKIGDILTVQVGGFGFDWEDLGVQVKVVDFDIYFGENGLVVEPYGCELVTEYPGDPHTGAVGIESFGINPGILKTSEMVESPSHYDLFPGVEAIQVIASSLTVEEYRGYCLGNLLKYRLRCGKKDNVEQELAKADKYKELFEQHKHLCKEE